MLNPDNESGARELTRVAAEYGLKQLITPTRITQDSATMIDLLFTTIPESFKRVGCEEVSISNHEMIYGELNQRVDGKAPKVRLVRCLSNCDQHELIKDMAMAPWSVLDAMDDVNDHWECWKKLFNDVIEACVPLRRVRVRDSSLPWIDQKLRKLIHVRNYYSTKAKRGKKAEDWEKYWRLRNDVTCMVRQARVKFFEKLGVEAAKNPRKMWRELEKIMGSGKKQIIESLRTSAGLVMDQQGVVDVLNKHFLSWVGKCGDKEGGRE